MRHKTFLITVIVLALTLSVALTGCSKKADKAAKLGLSEGGASTSSGSSSAEGTSTEGLNKPGKLIPANEESPLLSGQTDTSTGGGDEGAGTGSSGTAGGSTGSGGSGSTPAKPAGLNVKILWWNDTASKAPNGCEIVWGSDTFKPDTAKDAASDVLGPIPYDKVVNLVVYPDGRGGKKLVVPFEVDRAMMANSDRDAIHVEVSDTRVRVLGNPIDGFDRTFDRF